MIRLGMEARPAPEPVRAVIVASAVTNRELILFVDGRDGWYELREGGVDDPEFMDIEPVPGPGVWVWEGVIRYRAYHSFEGDHDTDVEWRGRYRGLTEDELRCVRLGLSPWGPEPEPADEPVAEPLTDLTGCDV